MFRHTRVAILGLVIGLFSAVLGIAQQITLTNIPAYDDLGAPISTGIIYLTWNPFTDNNGNAIQGSQRTVPISGGVFSVTLAASDNAGYVYHALVTSATRNSSFWWKVPAAGASTQSAITQPPQPPVAGHVPVYNSAGLLIDSGAAPASGGSTPVMTGASSGAAGTAGSVPAPQAGQQTYYLTGAGTWAALPSYTTPTLNQILGPTAATSIAMANYHYTMTFGTATGTGSMAIFTDSAGNTGTGYVLDAEAVGTNTAGPFRACTTNGCLWVDAYGQSHVNGNFVVNQFSVSGAMIGTLATPTTSSASCTVGQFEDDANYHYVCTATNTWKRAALTSF